ncbi:MAG: hypothetical protein HYY25_09660 [Candidatus Wallbacteria bacterium]|nr:hypothetical protein [Candidatus Wallbacteria bacterium]
MRQMDVRRLWTGLRAAALAVAAGGCIVPAPSAAADPVRWMNGQLGSLFAKDERPRQAAANDVQTYLRHLQEPAAAGNAGNFTARAMDRQAPGANPFAADARAAAARAEDWSPRIEDALEALRFPPGTQSGLQAVEDAAFRAARLSSRIGFGLPAQVLQNLAAGTEPLRKLLVSYREGLKDASGTASIDRIHRGCEKLLGQVQNNYNLVQQAQESLDGAGRLLDKGRGVAQAALERHGDMQALPLVAAFTEVHLRARTNLESAKSYLLRAQAVLRGVFQTARRAQLYAEGVQEKSFRSPAATFTLEDQPDAIDRFAAGFEKMRDAVARALDGVQTAHGLLYVSQKSLLELLYTLRPAEAPRPFGPTAMSVVGRAMGRSVQLLTEGLQAASVEVARQKQWRESLEAYKTPLFELGALPEWVFGRDTILVGGGPGATAAGPLPDIERVIASLETAPAASAPPELPAATSLPLVDLEILPDGPLSSAAQPATSTPDTAYHLPSWY